MLQKSVNQKMAYGVPGDIIDTFPRAIDPKIVSAGSIGKFYTINTANPERAVLGGTGVLGGIAVNTKEYIVNGLGASLDFRDGDVAQLMRMGRVCLQLPVAVTVGMAGFYNTTTGEITAAASGSEVDGCAEIPDSEFVLVNALANEISVLELK